LAINSIPLKSTKIIKYNKDQADFAFITLFFFFIFDFHCFYFFRACSPTGRGLSHNERYKAWLWWLSSWR